MRERMFIFAENVYKNIAMTKNQLKTWAACFLTVGSLIACSPKEVQPGDLNVIPLPQEVTETASAAPFVIRSSTSICYPAGNDKLERTARFLASYIKKVTGTEVKISTEAGENCIVLGLDSSIQQKDGYELTITADRVILNGSTEAGVFYGVQTIHKALPITEGKALASLPAGTVKDYPQYGYRGFMIDVGRHYFSVDYLKELIDVMALHNINYFHWHLTEDQGWRIEIKKYPKLTEIGSVRKETITAPGSGKFDGTPVSGFYTQEEAKEIVAYAAERFITVIPEIDMPGHMLAALASYPELGCTGGPYEVATKFGVFPQVLCGGNEKTLQFAKDVVNELMDIFPDAPYIHIGGDECPKAEWRKCPKCQAKIRELGLRDTKEHSKENQLQVYFMSEVEKEIAKRGKKMLAWDEILEGNPDPKTTTVAAWTGVSASIKAAKLGHKTIVCPITYLYFSNPGYNRLKGVSSVGRVYNFEPASPKLTEEEKKNIIGVQGCIWTEWTKDSLKMEWQMMPRIAALSELQWSNPAKKDLNNFLKRLRHQLDLYTLYGLHYKEDIEDVVISAEPTGEDGAACITLSTFDNAPIYYTLDGSNPTVESQAYTQPFTVKGTITIKAKAIRNGRESNTAESTLEYNLATMRPITLNSTPDESFTYKGASLLVDGLPGDDNYRSGRYVGFYGKDFDALIDLQEEREISSVSIGTYLVPGDYIFGLTGIEVYGSEDGKSFKKIASKSIPTLEKGSKNNVLTRQEITFAKTSTRYVRVVGKCTPVLPKWHSGAGKKTFLFIDEVAVN